jgi:hypothetical protein
MSTEELPQDKINLLSFMTWVSDPEHEEQAMKFL